MTARAAYETALTTVSLGARYETAKGVSLTAGVSDVFDEGPKQKLLGANNHFSTWTTCRPA